MMEVAQHADARCVRDGHRVTGPRVAFYAPMKAPDHPAPAFVVNQVPHQREKTLPVARLGAAVDLGLPEDFDPKKIIEALNTSIHQLETMSRKGKTLVDGRGIYRVAEEIQSLLVD